MRPVKDLSGKRFGHLTVIEMAGKSTDGRVMWRCMCDCGKSLDVRSYSLVGGPSGDLLTGNTKSCGCAIKEPRPSVQKDLTGQRFGKLTAIRPTDQRKDGYVLWECKCDCGNITEVKSALLTSGKRKSCGCAKKGT